MVTIYRPDSTVLLSIEVDDESYHFAEVMGRNDVTLYFALANYVDIPVGSYIIYGATAYTLYSTDKMVMQHRRDFEYTLTLESVAVELDNCIYTNPNDGRFKFPLTALPQEHLSLLCRCMTEKTGETWTGVSNIAGTDKLISYDAMTCLDALTQIADAYETEYRIEGTTIYLGKVEFYTDIEDQVVISYGKGNGLRPGIERTVDGDEKVLGKVYIQGGDRNIDYSEYGSATLLLPKGETIWYNGDTFYGTAVPGAKQFAASDDGRFVSIVGSDALAEGALDLTEVYPSYEHTVSRVEEVNSEDHFWDIYSDSFWDGTSGIDYADCLIANGTDMTIIFQSGMLAGREFGVKWRTVTADGATVSRMEIVPSEQDGYVMPDRDSGFYPKAGDTFRVFNIYLPNAYIKAAETEMFHEAVKYLYEHSEQKFSIKGEIDPIWSSARWLEIGGHFKPGAYFRFIDPVWETGGVSLRIMNIKTYINKPHRPVVELSNATGSLGVSSALKRIEAQAKVLPDAARQDSLAFTKRSFRDAQETMEAIANAMLDGFSESISPIAVQTMQLIAGDESLQFQFYTNRRCTTAITNPLTYDVASKKLTWVACALKHMTLGITDIKPSSARALSEYLRWSISAGESAVLDDAGKVYYVYAKCAKGNNGTSNTTGQFILSETAVGMEDVSGYYHFLVGILNAERDGSRSFAPVYGYTEVLPGQITTDVIRSANGSSYFDLSNNAFSLGDKLRYNTSNDGRLILNGTFVQTGQSGTVAPVSAWCGQYSSSRTYQKGDEVWYSDNGTVSSYIYINDSPTSGILPTNTTYWEPSAIGGQGTPGVDGQGVFKSIVFLRSATAPATPTGGDYLSPTPIGWSDGVPSGTDILWMSTRIFTSDGNSPQQSAWTTPRQATSGDEVEYKWSSNETEPYAPDSANVGANDWHDTPQAGDIWMAQRKRTNGTWSSWVVFKILGEDGAAGANGRGISSTTVTYGTSNSASTMPSSWSSTMPTTGIVGMYLWTKTVYSYTDSTTSDPIYSVSRIGADGVGTPMARRGNWNANTEYYGSGERVDVVYHNGQYWVSSITAPSSPFSGSDKEPAANSDYWLSFGASFDNIASGLFFAEKGYIDNAVVRILETSNTDGNGYLVAQDNHLEMYDSGGNTRLFITGNDLAEISSNAGSTQSTGVRTTNAVNGYAQSTWTLWSLSVTNSTNILSLPSLSVTARRQLPQVDTTEPVELVASYLIDGTVVSTVSLQNTVFTGAKTQVSVTLPSVSANLSEGDHTVSLYLYGATPSSTNLAQVYTDGAATMSLSYMTRSVQIGANGFRAAFSSTCYASFLYDSTGENSFIFRNGNYGFRISSSGIQKSSNMNANTPSWTNL